MGKSRYENSFRKNKQALRVFCRFLPRFHCLRFSRHLRWRHLRKKFDDQLVQSSFGLFFFRATRNFAGISISVDTTLIVKSYFPPFPFCSPSFLFPTPQRKDFIIFSSFFREPQDVMSSDDVKWKLRALDIVQRHKSRVKSKFKALRQQHVQEPIEKYASYPLLYLLDRASKIAYFEKLRPTKLWVILGTDGFLNRFKPCGFCASQVFVKFSKSSM